MVSGAMIRVVAQNTPAPVELFGQQHLDGVLAPPRFAKDAIVQYHHGIRTEHAVPGVAGLDGLCLAYGHAPHKVLRAFAGEHGFGDFRGTDDARHAYLPQQLGAPRRLRGESDQRVFRA